MRPPDRRGIAEDLFQLAGSAEVDEGHIDDLSKRYRERFAGAQKVLLVAQVGQEILRWQNAPRSVPPRPADARREDDEIIGIDLDPLSSMGRAVGLEGLATPAPAPSPLAPKEASPAPDLLLPALDLPGSSASSAPAAPVSAAERPRAPASEWAASGRPSQGAKASVAEPAPPAEAGLWAPLRSSSPPGPDGPELGLEPLPASRRARPPSDPPPPPPPMELRVAGESSRPPPSSGLTAAGAPSSPLASPPLAPPPDSISGAPVQATIPGPPAAPGFVPVPTAAPRSARSVEEMLRDPKRAAQIAGAALACLVLLLVVMRPSCLFSRGPAPVQGRFTSEHLGVAAAFPEAWHHQPKLDSSESRGDWDRASSVFYRGVSAEEFLAQITIVTLTHDDRGATDADLRDVARTELSGNASGRFCTGYDRYGTRAMRCTSVSPRGDRRYAMVEEYFLAGRRIVFARALVEAMPGEWTDAPSAPPPETSAPPANPGAPTLKGQVSPLAEMDAREIEGILDSIEAVGG